MSLTLVQDKFLRYKYISISADKNKITTRILLPIVDGVIDGFRDKILTTDSLLGKHLQLSINGDKQLFEVIAECVFNKTTDQFSKWWRLGDSIDFIYNTTLVNKGIIQCIPLSLTTNVTGETKYEHCRRNGYELLASVNCNDLNDVSNNSIIVYVDVKGYLYTNLLQV